MLDDGLRPGALAASFSVSGQQFKVSADQLEATGFVQYGTVDARTEPGAGSQRSEPVAVAVAVGDGPASFGGPWVPGTATSAPMLDFSAGVTLPIRPPAA